MKTIGEFLENSVRKFPEKEAIVMGEVRLSYLQFDQKVQKVKNFLIHNCEKQEVVSLFLGNSIEFLTSYFGILQSGCIAHVIPINTSENNLRLQLEEVEPRFLLSNDFFGGRIENLGLKINLLKFENIPEFENLEREVLPEDISTIMYSSGTTSRPKGVKLQHKNVVKATENMLEVLGIHENDSYLNVLPLSHSFGLGNVHMTIRQGGRVIIEKNAINPKQFLQKIIDEKASVFAAAPATFRLILDTSKELFKQCSLRVMVTNSTAIPKETTLGVLESLPSTQFYMYYGLTEASRSTFINFNSNQDKMESVGPATPNVKVKIVNEEGLEVEPFQKGEVCVLGEHVITEYWKNEEASKSFRNGWMHTGDFGYLDQEGFLYLVGRNDDMINVAGEKVSPLEIEKTLSKLEGVKESAAIGVQDRIMNQVVNVCVVKDKEISESEIIGYLRQNLEGFKVPRRVHFVDEIPKTDSGKLKRGVLKDSLINNL